MKRLLQILGLLILLIVGAALILPVVFKDEIFAKAQEEINKNVKAKVHIEDFSLSLFKSFPSFNFRIQGITVDGQEEFEGVRLVDIGKFEFDLDLLSVLSGDEYKIHSIALSNTKVHVIVNENGKANYDIATSASDTTVSPSQEEASVSSSFKLALKSYEISNFDLVYSDKQGDMLAVIKNLNHRGSGDFTQEIVELKTKTSIDELSFNNAGVNMLNKASAKADFDMEFNQPEFKISFGENSVSLNELLLNFDGFIALPDDNIEMDLNFSTPQNQFKDVLSLIPAVYTADFADVKTDGKFDLSGSVKGIYNGEKEIYPPFDLSFNVKDASFQYPDLPASVNGINVKAHVFNKTTQLDGVVVEVPEAKATVAGSPVNARLWLKTPMSDPDIEAYLKTDFDLANVAKVVPMEGFDYKGKVKGDLDIAAMMSDIDNERYEKVKAEGSLGLEGIHLASDSMPMEVNISKASLLFSPQYVDLQSFDMTVGKTDVSAKGRMDNLLAFALNDEVLKAHFEVNSRLIDLDEMMAAMGADETAVSGAADSTIVVTDSVVEGAIRIPENIDFELNTSVEKVVFNKMDIEKVRGKLSLKDGEARMDNLNMNMLEGSLALKRWL